MKKQQHLWYLYGVIFTAFGIAVDQWTKQLAIRRLKEGGDIVIWENVFRLHYLENRGAAFGLLEGKKAFFLLAAAILLTLGLYFYRKLPFTRRFAAMRLCMIGAAAGGIGNGIDRVTRGYVVDFFYFELIDFPVFNVADIYVVLALFTFCYLTFFYFKDEDYQYFTFKRVK